MLAVILNADYAFTAQFDHFGSLLWINTNTIWQISYMAILCIWWTDKQNKTNTHATHSIENLKLFAVAQVHIYSVCWSNSFLHYTENLFNSEINGILIWSVSGLRFRHEEKYWYIVQTQIGKKMMITIKIMITKWKQIFRISYYS